MSEPLLEEVSWKEALPKIRQVNPELAAAIEELNPSSKYTFIKAKYPWGQHILTLGTLFLPNTKGDYVPINDSSIPTSLQKKIDYNSTVPLGLVVDKSAELYIEVNHEAIPYMKLETGKLFGLWPTLQEKKDDFWECDCLIAGTKSLFFLSKISDVSGFRRLKKEFLLKSEIPSGLRDQNGLLLELSNKLKTKKKWEMEILYFSKEWMKKTNKLRYQQFEHFLLRTSWTRKFIFFSSIFNLSSYLLKSTI